MADTFTSLAEKYDNFMVPAMSLKIKGSQGAQKVNVVFSDSYDDNGDVLVVDGVNISLSIDRASSLRFNILNSYNLKSSSFNSDTIQLGDVVEASIGYGSNLTLLFKGYVCELSYDFSENVCISVTALDARALMEKNIEPSCPADTTTDEKEKKTEQVLKNLLAPYSNILSYSNVKLKGSLIPRGLNMNDWDYLQSILGESRLTINGGELFEIDPEKAEVVNLEYGKGLNSFSFSESYQNIELVTETFDESDPSLSSKVSAELESDGSKPTSKRQKIFINPLSNKTSSDAQSAIDKKKKKLKRDACSITADFIGIPEITAGKTIKFSGLTKKINEEKYVITSAVHILNSSGYKTSVSISSVPEIDKMFERWTSKMRVPHSAFGTVTALEDDVSEHKGKVKVKIKNELGNEENEIWASMASVAASAGNGVFMRPEIDSDVIVNFIGGDMLHPVIVGSVWNDRNASNETNASEQNYIKEIRTKAGHYLRFDDDPDNASLELCSVAGHKIYINDKEKTILITTPNSENNIKLSEEEGSLAINSKNKITLQVDNNEAVSIEKDKISFKTQTFEVSADSKINMEKGQIKIEGSALNLSSSGNAEIKGSSISVKGDTNVSVSGQIINLG